MNVLNGHAHWCSNPYSDGIDEERLWFLQNWVKRTWTKVERRRIEEEIARLRERMGIGVPVLAEAANSA
jgi:hypothetical protein